MNHKMIKPNELRIGNWVYNSTTRQNMQVYPMMIPQLHRIEKEEGSLQNCNIEAIPLTEEILLRCGFKSDGLFYEFRPVGYVFKSDFTYLWIYDVELKACICVKCEYLHRLQNLCFEFTGRELEVNL